MRDRKSRDTESYIYISAAVFARYAYDLCLRNNNKKILNPKS